MLSQRSPSWLCGACKFQPLVVQNFKVFSNHLFFSPAKIWLWNAGRYWNETWRCRRRIVVVGEAWCWVPPSVTLEIVLAVGTTVILIGYDSSQIVFAIDSFDAQVFKGFGPIKFLYHKIFEKSRKDKKLKTKFEFEFCFFVRNCDLKSSVDCQPHIKMISNILCHSSLAN